MDISNQINKSSTTVIDVPINLQSLLSGKITDPIILNKSNLQIPNISSTSPISKVQVKNPSINNNIPDLFKTKTVKNEIKKEIPNSKLKTTLTVSLDNKLQTLNDIIDSKNPEINTSLKAPSKKKETAIKTRGSKISNKDVDIKRMSKSNINEEKKIGEKGIKSGKKNDNGKNEKKLSKAEINVNISGTSGKNKIKNRPSLSSNKPKEVKLPTKLIKMKDMISLKYNEPIHDVKEIPRFDIYMPKNK